MPRDVNVVHDNLCDDPRVSFEQLEDTKDLKHVYFCPSGCELKDGTVFCDVHNQPGVSYTLKLQYGIYRCHTCGVESECDDYWIKCL